MPKRVQWSRFTGEPLPPNSRLVTRPGRFGNMFAVGKPAPAGTFCAGVLVRDREHAVELFRVQVGRIPGYREMVRADLAGKDLACSCPLDGRPCHADVLLWMGSPESQYPDARRLWDHLDVKPNVRILDLLPARAIPTCWLCGARDVTGTTWLRMSPVPACAEGTGCQDATVFHGPTGPPPHKPDEACVECGTDEAQTAFPRQGRRARVALDDGSRGH